MLFDDNEIHLPSKGPGKKKEGESYKLFCWVICSRQPLTVSSLSFMYLGFHWLNGTRFIYCKFLKIIILIFLFELCEVKVSHKNIPDSVT